MNGCNYGIYYTFVFHSVIMKGPKASTFNLTLV